MDLVGVDGRTDVEKLHELLALGGERTQVDFKETLDLSDKREELCFVKDAVAMLNYYPGGYIVIGADNEGNPSDRSEGTDWKQFDGARLRDKLKRYIDGPFDIASATHVEKGHTYCIICLMSSKNGLPIPFKKLGQAGNNDVVFHKGEFVRRNGAQNAEIEYSQWGEILEQHDKLIREDESRRVNDLIERFTASFAERG
ncbi:MAG: ATP-binding protein [Eggerthellaceae bacterium]|nr:ATP-binding protein [Eggerthellaceae bacterium]